MKKEDLYESIGGINEELLARSEETPASGRILRRVAPLRIAAAAAACVCVAAALTALPFLRSDRDGDLHGTVDVGDHQLWQDENVRLPTWEESDTVRRFPEVEHTGICYTGRSAAVPAARIGETLGSTTLTGYDVYENRSHTANAEIFRIDGISEGCAVALRFEGEEVCYPYVNSSYAPETLGQMIEDLDLASTLSFGPVYGEQGSILYTGRSQGSDGNTAAYTGLPADAAWAILLSNDSAEAVEYDSLETHTTRLYDISVNLSLLGYENVSMAVTEEGYLTTNLLDSGKAFDIGKDAAKAFTEYMDANFEAKEILPSVDGDEIPE